MRALQLDPDEPIPDNVLEQLSSMKNEQESHRDPIECSKCNRLLLIKMQVLERMMKLKAHMEQYLRNSIYSAFMITNLVNDLLDLAKMENNAFQLTVGEVNLVQIVEEVFQVVSFQAEASGIQLKLVLDQSKS